MTLDDTLDQADGLRRMMTGAVDNGGRTRIISIVGAVPGCGATDIACTLAAAMVRSGQNVLLLDEHHAADHVPLWQQPYRSHWSDVVAGSLLSHATSTSAGVYALPANASTDASLPDPEDICADRIVIIDAALQNGRLSTLASRADQILVVLPPATGAIQAAYATIKSLHFLLGLRRLPVLMNHATQLVSQEEGKRTAASLAAVGAKYLGLAIESVAAIGYDPHLLRARELKASVIETFPRSAAAMTLQKMAQDILRQSSIKRYKSGTAQTSQASLHSVLA